MLTKEDIDDHAENEAAPFYVAPEEKVLDQQEDD